MVLINPEILWRSDETVTSEEGCLSIPEIYDDVSARPGAVRWTDLDGERQEREFDGLGRSASSTRSTTSTGGSSSTTCRALKRR